MTTRRALGAVGLLAALVFANVPFGQNDTSQDNCRLTCYIEALIDLDRVVSKS